MDKNNNIFEEIEKMLINEYDNKRITEGQLLQLVRNINEIKEEHEGE